MTNPEQLRTLLARAFRMPQIKEARARLAGREASRMAVPADRSGRDEDVPAMRQQDQALGRSKRRREWASTIGSRVTPRVR
jgi:hypothetical protein